MAETKRIPGNYTIDPTGTFTVDADTTITGNLTVNGTTSTINTTDLAITDNIIVLNQGELGAGVSLGTDGIEIDRGSLTDVQLRWNDTLDFWELTLDGAVYDQIVTVAVVGTFLNDLIDDVTPQLGGDLDVNGKRIISAQTNQDVEVDPAGTGALLVTSPVKYLDQTVDPSSLANYNFVYSKVPVNGNTGVFVVNTSVSDELVGKRQAVAFSLLF